MGYREQWWVAQPIQENKELSSGTTKEYGGEVAPIPYFSTLRVLTFGERTNPGSQHKTWCPGERTEHLLNKYILDIRLSTFHKGCSLVFTSMALGKCYITIFPMKTEHKKGESVAQDPGPIKKQSRLPGGIFLPPRSRALSHHTHRGRKTSDCTTECFHIPRSSLLVKM